MTTLELKSHEGNPRNSEGSFVSLKDGRIMFIYTRYYGKSGNDEGSADLAARYSSDDGKTWTAEDEIIWRNECATNIMSVSLLRLKSGKIAMVFLKQESIFDCRPVFCLSDDEGKSWSKPTFCINTIGHYVVNNDRIIQTKSGRIIIPVAYHRSFDGRKDDKRVLNGNKTDKRAIVLFYYSDDEGLSWQESKEVIFPPADKALMQEPGIIELNDGTLWAWARTEMGSQYVSYSKDDGDCWSPALPSNFKSPCSPMSVKRNPKTNELIAIWNDKDPRWNIPAATEENFEITWDRNPLVMAKSCDDGKTWKDFKILESDPTRGYCYTAIYFVDEGMLLAYCCGSGLEGIILQDSCIKFIKA